MAAKMDVFIAFVPCWRPPPFTSPARGGGEGRGTVSHGEGHSPVLFNHSGPAISMMNALDVAHDGVDHDFAPARKRVRGCHLALEDAREGRAVGDVEEAQ